MNTTTQSNEKDAPHVALPVDLRDWFAGKAMNAAMNAAMMTFKPSSIAIYASMSKVIAEVAYIVADAMLKARDQ
ncbi:hypothetical protein [Burkholderia sp. ABCPW 14]|uniref:hypothetical protein n=1 Tax=Burkholderia sp. ABCPW 14 TaxID=1637860 RepID=UPI0012E3F191|nr:hypothetical protein [Burkholderia sp. ABCPW 14]